MVQRRKTAGVPVSLRALIQRINRKLKENDQQMRAPRGARSQQELGDYYILDWRRNVVVSHHVDPEVLGRELQVLQRWEQLVGEGDANR